MLIQGKCHCNNIAFLLDWPGEPSSIPARACTCSFCVKHGGVWTSHPKAKLEVTVRDPSIVSKYGFGTRTAVFYICTHCGIVPIVTCEIERDLYAVVSVNAFENVPGSFINRAPANFGDEEQDIDARLARRKRNWIADVRLLPAP